MIECQSDRAEQVPRRRPEQLDHFRRDHGLGVDDAVDRSEVSLTGSRIAPGPQLDDHTGESSTRERDERPLAESGILGDFLGHAVVEQGVDRHRKGDAHDRIALPRCGPEKRSLHEPIVWGGSLRERRNRGSQMKRRRVHVRDGKDGRELIVDGTFASFYRPGSSVTGSVWDAIAAPLLAIPTKRRRSVLILGLGGGSAARIVRAIAPAARIVGVELDPAVVRAAREHLDLDELAVDVIQEDALSFLQGDRGGYDAILEDVFVGEGDAVHKPGWLPRPGLELAAERLAPGGVLVSNTLDEARSVSASSSCCFPLLFSAHPSCRKRARNPKTKSWPPFS